MSESLLRARIRYVLPDDVSIVHTSRLSASVRKSLGADAAMLVVQRPANRAPAKLVSATLGELLEAFRTPVSIAQALKPLCRNGESADELLYRLLPTLQALARHDLLVAEDSPARTALRPRLQPGDDFASYRIIACAQASRDCDVYSATDASGRRVALKWHHGVDEAGRRRLRREAIVLARLPEALGPRPIELLDLDGGPVLVSEWLDAESLRGAAERTRQLPTALAAERLLTLAASAVGAYSRLHSAGVLHGDVHPSNVLVDRERRAWLVDFGWSPSGEASVSSECNRGGHPAYFEPELAAALLAGKPPPQVSSSGEQYALAAMIHWLLTGTSYFEPVAERDALLARIATEEPRSLPATFAPPLREALQRCLAKEPSQRFESIQPLVAALQCARVAQPRPDCRGRSARFFEALADYQIPITERWPDGTHLSISSGPPGVGYALYRAACLLDRADLLVAADRWTSFSLGLLRRQPSPTDAIRKAGAATGVGLLGGELGLRLVQALVTDSLADRIEVEGAVTAFEAASRTLPLLELHSGLAGSVLGCALLLERGVSPERVRLLGDALAAELWFKVQPLQRIGACPALPRLGMAHGWAGILHALLRWAEATAQPASDYAARLLELADLALTSATGARVWRIEEPRPNSPHQRETVAWWCNGSAGHLQLWILAQRLLKDDRLLELAIATGHHLRDEPQGSADLCCGLSGRAYALLSLYRETEDERWLTDATRLAQRATDLPTETDAQHRLFKGGLGPALLQLELAEPALARMPLVERW